MNNIIFTNLDVKNNYYYNFFFNHKYIFTKKLIIKNLNISFNYLLLKILYYY